MRRALSKVDFSKSPSFSEHVSSEFSYMVLGHHLFTIFDVQK